jgi:hypothetical protein
VGRILNSFFQFADLALHRTHLGEQPVDVATRGQIQQVPRPAGEAFAASDKVALYRLR